MTARAAAAGGLTVLLLLVGVTGDPAGAATPSPSPTASRSPSPGPTGSRTATPAPATATPTPVGTSASPLPAPPTSLTPAPAPTLPLTVSLDGLDPRIPQPGATLLLTATVRNTSATPVAGLQARLLLGPALCCRSQVAAFAAGTGSFGAPVNGTTAAVPGPLAPGASATVRLRARVDDLGLPRPGVYELGVEVLAAGSGGPTTAGLLRTFLPWAPPHTVCAPLRLAWAWPLVDQPRQALARTFLDDALAGELAPGGRLATLLRAAAAAAHAPPPARRRRGERPPAAPALPVRAVPVTWVVDPMLLAEAAAMAGGYTVPAGTPRPGHATPGRQAAGVWLATLRAALAGADVVALPYADPDLVALARAGLDTNLPFTAGAEVTGGSVRSDGLYWPPGGQLDRTTALLLVRRGIRQLILDASVLPTVALTSYTPTDQVRVSLPGGTVTVLLTDTTLDDVVTTGATAPGGARLAEQRFLAETLVMDGEGCSGRDVLVAPAREWGPSAGYAAALLRDTATAPWLRPVTAAAQLTGTPDPAPRTPLAYPASARAAELPVGYLHRVEALQVSLDQFHLILLVPPRRVTDDPLQLAILRAESAYWRGRPVGAELFRETVKSGLSTQRGAVKIDSRGLYTLSSHSGAIPITVENDLLSQSVRIAVGFDNVRVSGSAPRVIPPRRVVQIEVRATAKTSGVIPVSVALFTVSRPPQRYSSWVPLRIRSTAYGAVALGITAGALGVLLLAVAVRLFRRAFRLRRRGPAPG